MDFLIYIIFVCKYMCFLECVFSVCLFVYLCPSTVKASMAVLVLGTKVGEQLSDVELYYIFCFC